MPSFIHDDFLLHSDAAQRLYHEFAKSEPIFDYHNHLPPADIANNHQFGDLAEIWLGGDHYKWRAMRANGVAEHFCTGDASPREKFDAWSATVPYTLRNPLYHWTHLELQRYFGIDAALNADSAQSIWDEANAQLPAQSVHQILDTHKIAVACTTDDPADSLDYHQQIAASSLKTRVYPTFRPDKAYGLKDPSAFVAYCENWARQQEWKFNPSTTCLPRWKSVTVNFTLWAGEFRITVLRPFLRIPVLSRRHARSSTRCAMATRRVQSNSLDLVPC